MTDGQMAGDGSWPWRCVAGCAQRPAALDQAQTALQTARADPDVTTYAAAELDAAQTQLQSANQAWEDGDGCDEAAHRAELATQQVEIARAARRSAQEPGRGRRAGRAAGQGACGSRPRRRSTTLQQQLASLQAKQTERGIVLTVGDVLFDVGPGDAASRGRSTRSFGWPTFLRGESGAQGAHRGPHRQHRLDHDQSGAVAAPGRGGRRHARRRRESRAIASSRPVSARTSRSRAMPRRPADSRTGASRW